MTPVRTCVGCRQRRTSSQLVRVTRGADGDIAVGRSHQGRGAWLCLDPSCWGRAVSTGALPRALRRPVNRDGSDLLEHLSGLLEPLRTPDWVSERP